MMGRGSETFGELNGTGLIKFIHTVGRSQAVGPYLKAAAKRVQLQQGLQESRIAPCCPHFATCREFTIPSDLFCPTGSSLVPQTIARNAT